MANISEKLNRQKVAIYIRVSTHWQIDKDSLQVQRRELAAYSEIILGIRDYEVFEDPGYSAKNTDRPAYQMMIDRLRTGEFSHILVWKIDRISRNLLDFATMYAELKELGITFVSKNEQFDTSSAIGEAMLKIILVFAELERQMTAERVTAVMLSRANNGQWNGGHVPFGYVYSKDTHEFSIDPNESSVFNQILDLYEDKQSLIAVCHFLNDAGIRTRNGKEWSPTGIHKILTNVFYLGDYRYNVHSEGNSFKKRDESEWITVPDHHVPMIDEVRFDRIQLMLKRNKRGGPKRGDTYVKKNAHVFGGILQCALCGSNMSATLDRRRADGWRPSIYACASRRKSSSNCRNKYISDATVGPFVFSFLSNVLKARQSVPKTTDVLQKVLLSGDCFFFVENISASSLESLLKQLQSGRSGMEYAEPSTQIEETIDERSILSERRRKDENALSRLKSLFLYGDYSMPEKDYIIERQKIIDDMNKIDARLSQLGKEDASITSDDQFMEKASYFIMVEWLLGDKAIDYEKHIRSIDPAIPRAFIKSVIERIEIADGRVSSITFKNGVKTEFLYKQS